MNNQSTMENTLPNFQNQTLALESNFNQLPTITFEEIPHYVALLDAKLNLLLTLITQANDNSSNDCNMPSKDDHIPMSFNDACKFISKGHSTMYALTSSRKIPFHKRGNKLYFFKDELLKWIETGGTYEVSAVVEAKEEQDFEAHLENMRKGKKHKAQKVED